MSNIQESLKELGLELPEAAPALFNYVPYVISGNTVYVAGQVPLIKGEKILGCVGAEVSIEEGQKAAQWCALNILAQVNDAVGGDWDKVVRCVKLGGFVNCPPGFGDQSVVINAASDLMVSVLGDRGKHARFAVGAPALPANFAVEVDGIFEIKA